MRSLAAVGLVRAGLFLACRALAAGQEGGEATGGTPVPESEAPGAAVDELENEDAAGEVPRAQGEIALEGEARASTSDPLDWDELAELDAEEIERRLVALAQAAGELGELETLGESRGGRPVRALTLTRATGERRGEVPLLLLADASPRGTTHGAEAILALGRHVLRGLDAAPLRELLTDRALVLAPLLDPDARAPEASTDEERERFDANFPLGWRPASLRPGSGDYPLSEPTARATAAWLHERTAVGILMTVGAPSASALPGALEPVPWPGAELPPADARVFERLAAELGVDGRLELVPWDRRPSAGGGLMDYAYQGLGIFPLAWVAPEAGAEAAKREAWLAAFVERAGPMLERLPRVDVERDALEELTPGVWQLDVAIRNVGPTPTLSALAAEHRLSRPLEITLEGARLVASARRASPQEPYRVGSFRPSGAGGAASTGDTAAAPGSTESAEATGAVGDLVVVECEGDGILGGGETRWLRLVLEAQAGSRVVLTARSVRAGTARLALELQ